MHQDDDCTMNRAAPYFLVDDVFTTAEFYRDVLGFTFDEFFGDPPSFTIVKSGAASETGRCSAQPKRNGRDIRCLHLGFRRRQARNRAGRQESQYHRGAYKQNLSYARVARAGLQRLRPGLRARMNPGSASPSSAGIHQ